MMYQSTVDKLSLNISFINNNHLSSYSNYWIGTEEPPEVGDLLR